MAHVGGCDPSWRFMQSLHFTGNVSIQTWQALLISAILNSNLVMKVFLLGRLENWKSRTLYWFGGLSREKARAFCYLLRHTHKGWSDNAWSSNDRSGPAGEKTPQQKTRLKRVRWHHETKAKLHRTNWSIILVKLALEIVKTECRIPDTLDKYNIEDRGII